MWLPARSAASARTTTARRREPILRQRSARPGAELDLERASASRSELGAGPPDREPPSPRSGGESQTVRRASRDRHGNPEARELVGADSNRQAAAPDGARALHPPPSQSDVRCDCVGGRSRARLGGRARRIGGMRRRRVGETAEPHDPVIRAVCHPDRARLADGDAEGLKELPGARALLAPLGDEVAVAVETLDPVVVGIAHEDVAKGVHGDPGRGSELPVGASGAAPGADEVPRGVELLDSVVARVCDVDVAGRVDRHVPRPLELTVTRPRRSDHGERVSGWAELLDAVVVGVRDVDVARRVGGAAPRPVELTRQAPKPPHWPSRPPPVS